MVDGYHFEKSINCHISATIPPISMKYGTVMYNDLLDHVEG